METTQRHIVILCSRLDLPGGIERAIVNTANLFAEKKIPVTLLVLDAETDSFYPLHPDIKLVNRQLSFGITPEGNIISRKIRLLSDVLSLRKELKKLKPSIIIATEYPFTTAAVLSGCKKYSRLYSWEHHHHAWLKKNKFWTTISNNAYSRVHRIICLNKPEADHFQQFAPVSIIPNFAEKIVGKKPAPSSQLILSVGWLIHRKGIDLMMTTAKKILTEHPGWKWKLIGDGEMKDDVLKFIKKEGLENRFILQQPGLVPIEQEYANADLFVLSSRYEAFPMVLIEALSNGLPCISFDCPSGPADIITDGEDGLLVEKEDPSKLAAAISSLINDEAKRKKMSENAGRNIQRFSRENIFEHWKELL